MRHTVIGVFDNDALAEEARNLLVDWGIPSDDVFVHDTTDPTGVRSNGKRSAKRRFQNLIEPDEGDEVGDVDGEVNQGEFIVVAAVDPDRADEVFHLLDDSGAVDIGLSSKFN